MLALTQANQEIEQEKGLHEKTARLLTQAGEVTRREYEEKKKLAEEKEKLSEEKDELAKKVQGLEAEMVEMYDYDRATQLTNYSYVCAFANSIWVAHAANRDLPAIQEDLQTQLMNYLDKNPPSAEYPWPLANLSAYGYDFSNFLEGVEVVDPMSLIPSTVPLSPFKSDTPHVEGVSPFRGSPLDVENVGGDPVGGVSIIGSEESGRAAPTREDVRRAATVEEEVSQVGGDAPDNT